jgi:hypothetical protein
MTVIYQSGSTPPAGKVYNVLSFGLEIITLRLLWSPLPRGRQSGVGLIFDTVPPMWRYIIIYPSVFVTRKLCRSNSVRTESNGDRSHKAMSQWRQFSLSSGGLTVFKAVDVASEDTERVNCILEMAAIDASRRLLYSFPVSSSFRKPAQSALS